MLQRTLETKIKLTTIPDSLDNTKPIHSLKTLTTNFNNNIMNTSATSNTTNESNINNIHNILNTETNNVNKPKKIYVYKRNIIKSKNPSPSTKRNKDTLKITNLPKTQRGIVHSSSSGNLLSKFTPNNNNQNKVKEDTFINIEDLLLLEDKFCDVINALSIKSSNLPNECFELLNFYKT